MLQNAMPGHNCYLSVFKEHHSKEKAALTEKKHRRYKSTWLKIASRSNDLRYVRNWKGRAEINNLNCSGKKLGHQLGKWGIHTFSEGRETSTPEKTALVLPPEKEGNWVIISFSSSDESGEWWEKSLNLSHYTVSRFRWLECNFRPLRADKEAELCGKKCMLCVRSNKQTHASRREWVGAIDLMWNALRYRSPISNLNYITCSLYQLIKYVNLNLQHYLLKIVK